MTTKATMQHMDKSGAARFAIDGLKRSIYFNPGMFQDGKIPATVEISLPSGFAFASPETAKPKAPRVPLTPAQKVEAAKLALAAAVKAAAAVATPKPVAVKSAKGKK